MPHVSISTCSFALSTVTISMRPEKLERVSSLTTASLASIAALNCGGERRAQSGARSLALSFAHTRAHTRARASLARAHLRVEVGERHGVCRDGAVAAVVERPSLHALRNGDAVEIGR